MHDNESVNGQHAAVGHSYQRVAGLMIQAPGSETDAVVKDNVHLMLVPGERSDETLGRAVAALAQMLDENSFVRIVVDDVKRVCKDDQVAIIQVSGASPDAIGDAFAAGLVDIGVKPSDIGGAVLSVVGRDTIRLGEVVPVVEAIRKKLSTDADFQWGLKFSDVDVVQVTVALAVARQ